MIKKDPPKVEILREQRGSGEQVPTIIRHENAFRSRVARETLKLERDQAIYFDERLTTMLEEAGNRDPSAFDYLNLVKGMLQDSANDEHRDHLQKIHGKLEWYITEVMHQELPKA